MRDTTHSASHERVMDVCVFQSHRRGAHLFLCPTEGAELQRSESGNRSDHQ